MEVSVRPIRVTEELRRLPTRLNTIALNRMLAPYPMVRGEYTRWAERHTRQQQYAKVHKGQGYRPKRKDQMTQLEFDTAVVTLERNGRGSIKTNCEERVFVAACQVMLRRHNMPDSWGWSERS